MPRRLSALFVGLVSIGLVACGGPFEVELPEQEPRLVVQSLFAADSLITVRLGQSRSVLDPDAPTIEGVVTATVQIYEDGVLAGAARYEPSRLRYLSDVRARAGRTYRVEIEAPGFEPVEAEDTVPTPVPFEVEIARGAQPDDPDRGRVDALTVRFTDPPGTDVYALYGLVERTFEGGLSPQVFGLAFSSSDPVLADGNLTGLLSDFEEPYYQRAYVQDRTFEGQTAAIRLTLRRIQDRPGTQTQITTRLRLATLSPAYYAYIRAVEADTDGTPFTTPRAVPSNVTGGYGIFAAFAASEQVLAE